MTVTRTTSAVALAAAVWMGSWTGLGASDELNRAKELYRSAAYDEALGVLDGFAPPTTETIEVQEYRVLCLVALDRRDAAREAMTALVTASPTYVMSDADAPPRVRAMFTDVRRDVLPGVVQRAYADAKVAFDRKDPATSSRFDRVLALLNDPDVAGNTSLADLVTVATGFRDLSKLFVASPPPPAAAPPRAVPAPAAPVIVAPVALSQAIPAPQIREEREWDGLLEVTINEQGRVTEARMVTPIHPVYDQQLIRAAMNWTYRPALRDGAPTISVKQVTIHVDTRPPCTARGTDSCRPASD